MDTKDLPLNMPCSDPEGCKHFKNEIKLEAENRKLKQKHWADLNTARCILLNRIEDINVLIEDLRLKELELKKALNPCF